MLLTNHLHMLLTPPAEYLDKLIGVASMRYAARRNRLHDGSGKLFEGRFLCYPVLGEGQLALTLAYIDNNPVRAGLCDDPADYPYSTHALHVGLGKSVIPPRIWTPHDWYLSLGPARYLEWVLDCQRRAAAPERVSLLQTLEAISHERNRRIRRPNETRAT